MVKGSLKPFLLALSVALVSNLFVGAVEAKPKAKSPAGSSDAGTAAAPSSKPAANDSAPQVVQDWEQRLFFKNFAEEDLTARLERIEKRIFGQPIEGAQEERLGRLDEMLKQKVADEQKQKEAEARRAGTTGGGSAPTAGTQAPVKDAAAEKEEELERARLSIQAAREQEIASLLSDGVALFRKKQGMQAQEKFEQVLRLDPTNAQAHFNLGIIEEAMGNFVEALSSYKQAAANDPGNKEYEEAVAAIEKKANAQANSIGHRADLRALAEQANAAWKRGEYYSALDLYQQLDQKEPNRALVKYNIGSIYLMLKDPDSALTAYEAAAKLEPGEQKYVKAYKELAAEMKRSSKEQAKAEAEATAEWNQENGVTPPPDKKGGGKKQGGQGQRSTGTRTAQAPVQQQRMPQQQMQMQQQPRQMAQQPQYQQQGMNQRPMQQMGMNGGYGNMQQGMAQNNNYMQGNQYQQPNQYMQQQGNYYPPAGSARAPAQQNYGQMGMGGTNQMQQPMQQMGMGGMNQMQQPMQQMGMAGMNQMQQPMQQMGMGGMNRPIQQTSMGGMNQPTQQMGMGVMNQMPMQSMQQPMQQQMAMGGMNQMPMQQSMQQPMQQQMAMNGMNQMQQPMQQQQRPMQQQQQRPMQQQQMMQQQPQQSYGTAGGGEAQAGSDMMIQFGFVGKSNGEGFTVVKVGNQSRAATAGLVAGDDIKAVDGIQVNNKEDILQVLSNINPAKRIPFLIMRNGNLAVLNL